MICSVSIDFLGSFGANSPPRLWRYGSTRSRIQGLRARKTHACRGAFRRYGSTRSRVQGLRARKTHACRGAFRGARKTHRPPSRYGSTRSRVQGLRARKTYAWTMDKCILPLAFRQLDCVISGRAVLGRKFLGRACRTPGRAARRC